jgi:hypothetical protein
MSNVISEEVKPEEAKTINKGNGESVNGESKTADRLADLDRQISEALDEISRLRGGVKVLPLFLDKSNIGTKTVDDVFDDLRARYETVPPEERKRLDVVLESSGGEIDAAYNIALLLRRYATEELNIIIPRWAKSAATVIACAGDNLLLTPVAELGPVDPQITMYNPLEERLEEFSPLDIDSTLDLIRDEFNEGNKALAEGLLARLQFPLTLGGIKKSLEVGTNYITRLLSTRMLRGDVERAKKAANCLVHQYSNHGFCIEVDEACEIGLKAEMLPNDQVEAVWKFRKLVKEKGRIEKQKKSKEVQEVLKSLPPELLKQIPDLLKKGDGKDAGKVTPSKEDGPCL